MTSTYVILDKPFPADDKKNILARKKTALVTITDDEGNTTERRYGVVTPEEIYAMIDAKVEINLNGCFIENFSLDYHRDKKGLQREDRVEIPRISAVNSLWEGRASFRLATFSFGADFRLATFSFGADFRLATFSRAADFYSATFSGTADFYSATFSGAADFRSATFSGAADFRSATFSGDAYFLWATFSGDTYFHGTQFAHDAIFDSAQFEKSVRFDDIEVKENLTFETAIFKGAAVFNKAEVKSAKFISAFFQYPVNFIGVIIRDIDLTGTIFAAYAVFNDADIASSGDHARETYRTMKHELLKTNNHLNAGQYRRKEMEAYHTKLVEEAKGKKLLKKNLPERFVLWFNNKSNQYGTNLQRAVILMFIVSISSFLIQIHFGRTSAYYQWGWNGLGAFVDVSLASIGLFIQFLLPTHKLDYLGENSLNGLGIFIDGISRLALGYLYFQIFQALRKFKST